MTSSARVQRVALVSAAIAALILSVGLYLRPARALTDFLVGALFVLGLSAGAMVWLSLLAVANAGWAAVLKRVLEGMGSFLPVAALLLLATTPGMRVIYEWARPEAAHDHLLAGKRAFLNPPFFAARMVVILGIWTLFSARLRRLSLAQDQTGGFAATAATRKWAAGFLALFAITACLGAFDWIMSLEPRWFSTIFGLYNLAGILVSSASGIAVASIFLSRAGALPGFGASHRHDVAKLMLSFSTFWAYMWFSQFLLIWYSNIPEETAYFEARWSGGWGPVFAINFLVNWVLPFLLLLPREAKRSERHLLRVALLLLAGRWLDLWLMTMPANFPRVPLPSASDLCGLVAPLGLFVFWVARTFERVPLVAKNDPYLAESLHHHT